MVNGILIMRKAIQSFIYSAGALLLITSAAKLISGSGGALVLSVSDPIFKFQFRTMFWIAGSIEFLLAVYCLTSQNIKKQVILVAWLATTFAAYRLGLFCIGYQKPCNCMGTLTDALHISTGVADIIMKVLLGYLLLGSYSILLFWLLLKDKKPINASLN